MVGERVVWMVYLMVGKRAVRMVEMWAGVMAVWSVGMWVALTAALWDNEKVARMAVSLALL